MDPSVPPFGSSRRNKGKGKKTNPLPTPAGAMSSSTQEGALTLSPIFMPAGPPSLKRPRSNTITSLPHIDERYLRNAPPSAYFLNLFHKINQGQEIGATTASKENVVMIEMIYQIHKDYRTAIDALSEQIEARTEEVSTLKDATPWPDTPTPIPFTLPATVPSRHSAPDANPLTLPAAAPPKSWATVARKGRKEKTTMAVSISKKKGYTRTDPVLPVRPAAQADRT